ncbi:hypothetical protein SNE40_007917 [Patella caerulea]|uniref:R3H domain-containing protein n=1 Tax=Patella caerulea TaxID=87958 RepID=A0AAN8JYW9_PATCE
MERILKLFYIIEELAIYIDDRYLSLQDTQFLEFVEADIQEFLQSATETRVLVFPPVDSYHRLLIHKVIEPNKLLRSFSIGEGDNRRTVVCLQHALLRGPKGQELMSSPFSSYPTGKGRGRGQHLNRSSPSPSGRSSETNDATARKSRDGEKPQESPNASGNRRSKGGAGRGRSKRPEMQLYVPRGRRNPNEKSSSSDGQLTGKTNENLTDNNRVSSPDVIEKRQPDVTDQSEEQKSDVSHGKISTKTQNEIERYVPRARRQQLAEKQECDLSEKNDISMDTDTVLGTDTTVQYCQDNHDIRQISKHVSKKIKMEDPNMKEKDDAGCLPDRNDVNVVEEKTLAVQENMTREPDSDNINKYLVQNPSTNLHQTVSIVQTLNTNISENISSQVCERENDKDMSDNVESFNPKSEETISQTESETSKKSLYKPLDEDQSIENNFELNNLCTNDIPLLQEHEEEIEIEKELDISDGASSNIVFSIENDIQSNSLPSVENLSGDNLLVDFQQKSVSESPYSECLEHPPILDEIESDKSVENSQVNDIPSIPVETSSDLKGVQDEDDDDDDDDESWDKMFDDNGDCLEPSLMDELTAHVGEVQIEKPKINYLEYQPKDVDLSSSAFGHLIEIYDFPSDFLTRDLLTTFQCYMNKGFDIKWVDDTHAIGIFSSTIAAQDALKMNHPLLKVRPIEIASKQSKLKAKRTTEFLKPYKERPKTTAMAARRLVSGALGLSSKVSKEKSDKEKSELREAKEKKRNDRKLKQDAWDGTVGKCAMDDS